MDNFSVIEKDKLDSAIQYRADNDWRFIQILAVKTEKGNDLIYSFMKDNKIENIKIENVTKTDKINSITDKYIAAFVFENEIHDLFGVNIENIAIDFKGKFYNVAQDEPMSVVSPEVIARRERQAKIDAAMKKKKKEAKDNG